MADDDDKDKDWLWHYVTRDVQPLGDRDLYYPDRPDLSPKPSRKKGKKAGSAYKPAFGSAKPAGAPVNTGVGLDRRTDQRLRRGQMSIEARLDLHGYGRDKAHQALIGFIQECYAQKKRCVLVITGKGENLRGALRMALPGWLSDHPIADKVLQFYPARQKDGGHGAFYILLKRQR